MKREVNIDITNLPEWQRKNDSMSKFIRLQSWFIDKLDKINDEMIYKKSFENQVLFVRDTIYNLLNKNIKCIDVISEHTSKSIKLPVYKILLNDKTEIIMRNNFYDWKFSIKTKNELNIPASLISDGYDEKISNGYCEGFDNSWVYDCYLNNKSNFTVELNDNYNVYTFLFLIQQQLNLREKKITKILKNKII